MIFLALGFTAAQKKAIDANSANLLVSAAAGSGKTAVLVERIIKIVLEGNIDIDKLLVVTFTSDAATEMRHRIGKAISDKLQNDPNNEHLRRQAVLLNRASISTIHSFCLNVIKRNFHMLDIEPNFRSAEESEISLLKIEAVNEVFERLYDTENKELFLKLFGTESNEDFRRLVECYGGKIKDDKLQDLVLDIHNFISANVNPEKWLQDAVEKFNLESKTIDQTVWADIVKKDIRTKLNGIISLIEKECTELERLSVPKEFLDLLQADKVSIESLLESTEQNFRMMYVIFNFDRNFYKRLPSGKKAEGISAEDKDRIKNFRDKEMKPVIKKIREKIFFRSPEDMQEDFKSIYSIMRTLEIVVMEFSKTFAEMKKEKSIVDYNDFEHFALKVLIDEEGNPTKEAEELQDKYEEIFIDEYQDSNSIQEAILTAVSRKNRNMPNVFMVGDVKQSIYRFRLANPELFRDKYDTYSTDDEGMARRIDLSQNFRSRKNILSSINFIFQQVMSKEFGEITYDQSAKLYYGSTAYNVADDKSTELYLIDLEKNKSKEENDESDSDKDEAEDLLEDLSEAKLEATIVAERIKKLVLEEKVELKDIAILLRSVKSVAEVYLEELKKSNIPAFALDETGYFDSIEVLTMLSFLQIIDNPRQDIHLLAVLHSPIYSIVPDELTEIRGAYKGGTFFDAINSYIETQNNELKNKLVDFLDTLNKFRDTAKFISISELLWALYGETDYYNYVGAYSGGNIRQANLSLLIEKAVEYEKTSFKGLFHFIRHIEKVQESDTKTGKAKLVSAGENLVRIMTIHKSKGLEFPIVFVCSLGKNFTFKTLDAKREIAQHHKYGLAPKYIDVERRIKYNTIAKYALNQELSRENLSEELRILYVALTRAKEKLILTGYTNQLKINLKRWGEFINYSEADIPPYTLLNAKNFLDIIVPALLRHRDFEKYWQEDYFSYNRELYNDESKFELICKTKSEIESEINEKKNEIDFKLSELEKLKEKRNYSGNYDEIKRMLEWKYPFVPQSDLAPKVSVSELKRMYYKELISGSQDFNEESKHKLIFAEPQFLQEKNDSFSAVQKGTILHTVLEHLDLHKQKNLDDVKTLLNSLQTRNILTEAEASIVEPETILHFINSELVQRMRNAKYIKTEVPFIVGMSPTEILEGKESPITDEMILVNGIIDCFFEEEGEIVLVDYKTDRYIENIEEIKNSYRIQIGIYKKAIERSTGMRVKEAFLYLLTKHILVKV